MIEIHEEAERQVQAELQEEVKKDVDNEIRGMISKLNKIKLCFMTIGGKGAEGCLIYIALSKVKQESLSHLRRQLRYLHM